MKAASIVALLAPILLTGCQSAGLTPALGSSDTLTAKPHVMTQNPMPVAGEYLIKLKPNVPNTADTLGALHQAFQSQSVQSIKPIGNAWYVLVLNQLTHTGPGLAFMQNLAKQSGLIETLQPNLPYGINPPNQAPSKGLSESIDTGIQ